MSNLIYFRGGGCKRPSIAGFEQQYNSGGRKHHHCLKRGVERVQKTLHRSFRATGVFEPPHRVEKKEIIEIRHNEEA